ncbi:hypothetical protein FACS1894159_10660 [Bacteroidia bacterium]|nr:hypothetical protein FACS1894159_10660 [Bacteroidia bacterium]
MKKLVYLAAVMFAMATTVKAQDDSGVKIEAGADVVSSYVWRGVYQTGLSVQPGVTASLAGVSLGAWGSADLGSGFKEFDLSLSYGIGGFSVGLTDYWWQGQGSAYFTKWYDYQVDPLLGTIQGGHILEATVSYGFGESFPLSLSWSTMLAGKADRGADDKQLYSSYFEAGYDFKVKDVDCTASIGISPWASCYTPADKDFCVTSLALKAAREITITDKFSLPVFAQVIFSPATDDAHLVFGITF